MSEETTTTAVDQEVSSGQKPMFEAEGPDRWLEVFSIFVHDLESPFATIKYLLGLIESGSLLDRTGNSPATADILKDRRRAG